MVGRCFGGLDELLGGVMVGMMAKRGRKVVRYAVDAFYERSWKEIVGMGSVLMCSVEMLVLSHSLTGWSVIGGILRDLNPDFLSQKKQHNPIFML